MLRASDDLYWDESFGSPGIHGNVVTVGVIGRELIIGGLFDSAGGNPVADLVKWDGTSWIGFSPGLNPALADYVETFVGFRGQLVVAGWFSEVAGVRANNIARWDGRNWSSVDEGINGLVHALALLGPDLYAGGSFTTAGRTSTHRIARWDGIRWHEVGGGVFKTNYANPLRQGFDDSGITALASDGTNLYVGGSFERAGDVKANGLAKWNGKGWSAVGERSGPSGTGSFAGSISALALSETNLYVAGYFQLPGSTQWTKIARWDGIRWHPLANADDILGVTSLAISGNDLYVGGGFHSIGGIEALRIAKWDGKGWSSLGSGVTRGGVTSMAVSNGQLFVGGQFVEVGYMPSTNIALWHIPRTLKVDVSNRDLILSWPKPDANFVLESSESLASGSWTPVPTPPVVLNNRLTVKEPISSRQKFYRLRQR